MSEMKPDKDRLRFESTLSQLQPFANEVDSERLFFDAGKAFAENRRNDPWKTTAAFSIAMSLVLCVMLVVQQFRHAHSIAKLQVETENQSRKLSPREPDSNAVDSSTSHEDGDDERPNGIVEPDSQFALIAMRQKVFDDPSSLGTVDDEIPEVVTDVFDPQQSYRFEIIKQLKKEILQTEKRGE